MLAGINFAEIPLGLINQISINNCRVTNKNASTYSVNFNFYQPVKVFEEIALCGRGSSLSISIRCNVTGSY